MNKKGFLQNIIILLIISLVVFGIIWYFQNRQWKDLERQQSTALQNQEINNQNKQ